ncbi:MAG: hypothetical protein K6C32_02665 [Bacilli bacterium]|nr:hypothetical protein [Bacilli bacterium]
MGKYIYIDKDSQKGRFGIGVGVFTSLTYEALKRIPDLIHEVENKKKYRTHLNKVESEIHHGVVEIKVEVFVKKGVNLKTTKERIIEEVNSIFMMMAEQIPVEVKVKFEQLD